jgi:hypothetical protein
MKKIYLFITMIISISGIAQVPVMNSITGAGNVCSSPAAPSSYTASASNSPTSYVWSVFPSSGVVIANGNTSVATISFPSTTTSFTVSCYATNGFGNSTPINYVVNVYGTPNVTFSGANTFCQGSSTALQASSTILAGSPTISYNWSPPTGLNTTSGQNVTASPASNTTYTVFATTGICSSTATINVIPLQNPTLTLNNNSITVCPFNTVVLTATGANNYFWTGGITNGVSFTPPGTGNYVYFVTGTSSNGCSATKSATVTVAACIGIAENTNAQDPLNIYPNPSNGTFMIRAANDEKIVIINETGQLISSFTLSAGSNTLVTGLARGVYFVITPGSRKKLVIVD